MDFATTVHLLLLLIEFYFVTGFLKPPSVYAASEQANVQPPRELYPSDYDFSGSSYSESIKRSLNKDMGKLSQILLHERANRDKFRRHPVRSFRTNKLVTNFLTSSMKRTFDITQSEILDANPAFIPNLNKQGLSFSNLNRSIDSISNNLSEPLSNFASNKSNHHNYLHPKTFHRKQIEPHAQSICGSRTISRVFLQLFKTWNCTSCQFTRSHFGYSNDFLTNCTASKVACCWLQNLSRRAKQSKKRIRTKRSLQQGESYIGTWDEIKKRFGKKWNITPTKKADRGKQIINSKHDPFRGIVEGGLVTLPANSRSTEERYEDLKRSRNRIFPGIYMKRGGRVLCISRSGKIRGVQRSNQINQYCAIRRIPVYSNEGEIAYRLFAKKAGYYLAMNGTFYLYTTKNSRDPNTEFLHRYNKNSHDAFKSKLHDSFIAFSSKGKPLNSQVNSTSAKQFHYLLEIDLQKLINMSRSTVAQPRRRKTRVKSSSTTAITTQTTTVTTTTVSAAPSFPAVSSPPTKKTRKRPKHQRNRKKKKNKEEKRRRKKKNKEARKNSRRRSKKRKWKKQNRKNKKGKRRQQRSLSYFYYDSRRKSGDNNKQSNHNFRNSFLLDRILKYNKKFSKSPTRT